MRKIETLINRIALQPFNAINLIKFTIIYLAFMVGVIWLAANV